MVKVRVGWALRGKPPGSHDDYTILRSAGRAFTPEDLGAILSRFSLGNPPSARQDGPGALPWVTVSEVQDAERHYLGLTIQEWSPDCDAAGRPIAVGRYFYLPYEAVSDAPVRYQGIYRELYGRDLAAQDGELVVDLPEASAAEQAARIEEIGFEPAATAAALLLDGPVTVTGGGAVPPDRRLAFFDAVAALLPYGWRTRFAAGTWHDNGSRHVRLAFAARPRPGTFELSWAAPREPPEGAARAREYLTALRDLTGGRRRTLTDIVAFLAAERRPLAGADPAEVLRILSELDWPVTVRRAAQSGRADPADLRRLFAAGRFRELRTAPERRLVFNALVGRGEVADLPLVQEHWHEAGGDFEVLLRMGRARLWRDPPAHGGAAYLGVAEALGFGGPYLAGLIEPPRPDERPDERPGGEAAIAELVRRDPPGRYPEAFAALVANERMVCELLHQLALDDAGNGNGNGTAEWLTALASAAPDTLVGPFRAVLDGAGEPVGVAALDRLAAHGD
ncbi:hypothetical protein, partial [Actinomadura roseirufa]|uniref:hypothetical protein n=1 Tax=Actinomadura roseirufa TaxID=2094049 RepID=UPI001A954E65